MEYKQFAAFIFFILLFQLVNEKFSIICISLKLRIEAKRAIIMRDTIVMTGMVIDRSIQEMINTGQKMHHVNERMIEMINIWDH